jgi:hypothetical protein
MMVPGGSKTPRLGQQSVELAGHRRHNGHAYQKHGNNMAGFTPQN